MKRILNFELVDQSGNKTHYIINFPDAGKLLRIEELKAALAPRYKEMEQKQSILSDLALDIVDMQSYFSVLCPQLLKDLRVSLFDLDIVDVIDLRKQYLKQYVPWWNDLIRFIQGLPEIPDQVEDKEDPINTAINEHDKVAEEIVKATNETKQPIESKEEMPQHRIIPKNRINPNEAGAEDVEIHLD